MSAPDLLAALERMSHPDRVRRMVELGRQSRTDAAAAARIADLEQGDAYHRRLALFACYGSRDSAHVLRALADASNGLRQLALALVALVCDDDQALAVLSMLPPPARRRLVRLLAARRRTPPIDAFLAVQTDDRAAPLLAYGSASAAAARAEAALEGASADDWRRLSWQHPELATTLLIRRAEAAAGRDERLRWIMSAALPALVQHDPDAALALVQRLRTHLPLAQLDLAPLLQRRPDAVADLLLESGERTQLPLAALARRISGERLQRLVARGLLDSPRDWLPTVPPSARRQLYEPFALGWRDLEGVVPVELVLCLPGELRAAEARRHLALPALAARAAQRLAYAAGLPWGDAHAAADPLLRSPDPQLRSAALAALIGAARFSPDHLPDALQLVRARRNEQDPVRLAMLGALAVLPPSRWREAHLTDLSQILRDALDAADCSPATASYAQQLALALLPFRPAWSVGWLATLARERGMLGYQPLDQLPVADVARIAAALVPVLAAWEPREREQAIFQAARLFGRRLEHVPALTATLERLTHDPRGWVASQALALLALHHRAVLPRLIPELVTEDPSWVTQSIILTFLHRRRQDLLTQLLGQTTYGGRFATGKTRFVLPLDRGFERWTSAQQATFAELLEQLTGDDERDSPALFQAVQQLAALPAVAPTRIRQLAALESPRPALRDVALRALGRLDSDAGVPDLLAALDDERAGVAIYALRRALRTQPPERARALLLGVPLRRVTVAKEVVRLLGDLPDGAGYGDVLAITGEEPHRDVRVAVLRALWGHLERAETWPILEAAARDADPAVAGGVVRVPVERASTETQRRIVALLAALLAHPSAQVRLDALQRCWALPVADREQALGAPLLGALASPIHDERAAAARAVFATYVGAQTVVYADIAAALLPRPRALVEFAETFSMWLRWDIVRLRPAAIALVEALVADPRTAVWQAKIAAIGLDAPTLLAVLRRLAAADALHGEAMMAAITAIEERGASEDGAGVEALETALRGEADARLRRIGLAALVGLAQPPCGWSAELRGRLAAYQADPSLLVAAAAHYTLLPDEDPEEDESGDARSG